MKTYLDCFPCFLKQALTAARKGTDDPIKIREVLNAVSSILTRISLTASPPEIGREVYKVVNEITGISDPFKRDKEECIDTANSLYPDIKEIVNLSEDRLLAAIRVAISGNVMDFGADPEFDLRSDLHTILDKDFSIFHYENFKEQLEKSEDILYLGDNAGETVFDRVLIEELSGKNIIYVVRDKPVINDAVFEDAVDSGIDRVAEIISSGCDAPGTILELCSSEFIERFKSADMIISKGQGNYESLSEQDKPIFYLLKTKCRIIARDIGVPVGSIILKSAAFK
ncbi:DUF89 family protein [bacterium]|nr:DUF89 family protein [bacterium]